MTEQEPGLISGRTMCSILEDMRKCCKTRNFSYLRGLIEEAQSRAWRMEDGLQEARGAAHAAWEALTDDPPTPAVAVEALEKRWRFEPRRRRRLSLGEVEAE